MRLEVGALKAKLEKTRPTLDVFKEEVSITLAREKGVTALMTDSIELPPRRGVTSSVLRPWMDTS